MSTFWGLAKTIFLGLLPYPDLHRRRQIRRAARALVTCDPWPGDDATPLQLTELCLLHALWLQREAHRAARFRHSEGAALLARSAIDTCFLGLYCQIADNPMSEIRGSNSEKLGRMMDYLIEINLVPKRVVDAVTIALGNQKATTPNPFQMAKKISEATNGSLALDLYRRLYAPLSTLFAHANGIVLLRHVGKDGRLSRTPTFPWFRRSAVRIVDVSVGILALAVAEKSDLPRQHFVDYANAHNKRSMTPVVAMGLRSAGGSMMWRELPDAALAFIDGANYVWSAKGRTDTPEERRSRIRAELDRMFRLFDEGNASKERDAVLESFSDVLMEFEPPVGATPPLRRLTRLVELLRKSGSIRVESPHN